MIFVECYADTTLVNILGIPRKSIGHRDPAGRSRVCNRLQNTTNALGLVDEDPHEDLPEYIQKLKKEREVNGTKLYIDRKNDNRIMLLCPNLETWILKAAELANIDVEERFHLPASPKKLHKIINLRKNENEKFIRLIEDLRKAKSPMLSTLEDFLSS